MHFLPFFSNVYMYKDSWPTDKYKYNQRAVRPEAVGMTSQIPEVLHASRAEPQAFLLHQNNKDLTKRRLRRPNDWKY